jgi:hypothetical protein
MTTREVGPDGLGARTQLEVGGRERHLKGIQGSSRDEYLAIRAEWAELTNAALERAGLAQRIDHRSLKAQGVDRDPTVTIPEKVWYAERAGKFSAAGNEIRARHRERSEARMLGPEALASVIEKQRQRLKVQLELDKDNAKEKKTPYRAITRDERNAHRREYYRKRRELEAVNPSAAEARRAASLRSYYLRMQKNPDAVRQARTRYRAEKGEELNRKQREYRQKNADALNQRRRDQRRAKAAEAQRDYKPGAPVDKAKAAALRWREYRERHGQPGTTAREAAQRWKKFRAEQKSLESATRGRQKVRQAEGIDSEAPQRTRYRRRDHDHER